MSEQAIPLRRLRLFIAWGFGSGLAPVAPGTFGTALAVFAFIPFARLNEQQPLLYAIWLVGFACIAAWAAAGAEAHYKRHDVGNIVIDEFHGYFTTMFLVPTNWRTLLAAFLIFRVLDIWKPPPARQIDRGWPRGWGVVLDDTAAGIYACLIMHALVYFSPALMGVGR